MIFEVGDEIYTRIKVSSNDGCIVFFEIYDSTNHEVRHIDSLLVYYHDDKNWVKGRIHGITQGFILIQMQNNGFYWVDEKNTKHI